MLALALIGIATAFAFVGVGAALAVAVMILLAGLVSMGILSTSVAVGLYRRSLTKGCITFIILSSSIGGAAAAAVTLYLFNYLYPLGLSLPALLLLGVFAGLLGGLLLGRLLITMIKRVGVYVKQRMLA